MDFYVDFCGNISPQTLCEYSLLSQPYTFTGIAYVKVSVDGPPEIFEKMRGKNVYNKVIEGIKNLIKVNQSVEIDADLSTLNKNNINDIIDLAYNLSVNSIRIRLVLPIGKNPKYNRFLLAPEEIVEVYKKIQRKKKEYKDVLTIYDDLILNESIERLATKSFTVDPYGYIRFYPFSSIRVGNFKNVELSELLKMLPSTLPQIKANAKRIQEYFNRIHTFLHASAT
ncbi:MAG: hypothetical protein QXP77_01150 [Candidatus Aenigmatarchaeota archaeon]